MHAVVAVVVVVVEGAPLFDESDGFGSLLLDELELELDDVGAGRGPVSVGAAPVAYPSAQDRTLDTYSIELLYRSTALTFVFSDMMSVTPEQRYRPAE